MRRAFLRGRENIEKRYQVHVAGYNLSILMRALTGKGAPRASGLRGRGCTRRGIGHRGYSRSAIRLGLKSQIRPRIPMGSRRVSSTRATAPFTTGC